MRTKSVCLDRGESIEKLHDKDNRKELRQKSYKKAWKHLESLAEIPIKGISIVDMQTVIDRETHTYYLARDMKTVFSRAYNLIIVDGEMLNNSTEFIKLPPLEKSEQYAKKNKLFPYCENLMYDNYYKVLKGLGVRELLPRSPAVILRHQSWPLAKMLTSRLSRK